MTDTNAIDKLHELGRYGPGRTTVTVSERGMSSSTGAPGVKKTGTCKWFNVAKGWGFIKQDDDGPDVFVHQSSIQMSGFRSLGDDERVEFEHKLSDKGLEATIVTGIDGTDCKGSHRRPLSKKRFRKIRCYNCGELANHIAAKCTKGPQPKRCHHCKSENHLIADCPSREEKKKSSKTKNSDSGSNDQSNHSPVHHHNDDPSSSSASGIVEQSTV